jgi:hypothetical protein
MNSNRTSKNKSLRNGVMLNAYPDSIGETLSDIVDMLKRPEFRDVFSLFYILPTFFNSDLDRGFSIIDYDLNKELVSEKDLADLEKLDIALKFDLVLNHLSVASPQFQDMLKHGDQSQYKDFFIDWNDFWHSNGEMGADGYLIPKAEGSSTLGTLWDSSIFPNRAPEGKVLLRSMMGGATDMAAIDLSEDEVKQRTMADLRQIMGIDAEPGFVRIFRHLNAIPQYTRGHAARLDAIEESLADLPGVFLTGNAFFGVGLNDCVNASNLTAAKVIEQLKQRR